MGVSEGIQVYFSSISVKNYRAFKEFSIDDLKQVNFIGGKNSVGKTALLETLFSILDRANPTALFRGYDFRSTPIELSDFEEIFYQDNFELPIIIDARTIQGNVQYKATVANYGRTDALASLPRTASTGQLDPTSIRNKRLQIESSLNGNIEYRRTFKIAGKNVEINVEDIRPIQLPSATFLSPVTRHFLPDIASRYASVVKKGQTKSLIASIRQIDDGIEDIEILPRQGVPIINLLIRGKWRALPLAGEGVLSLTNVLLSISESESGAVFIDEFDSTIFHENLKQIYEIIFSAALGNNVQLFLSTHSLEALQAAAEAAADTIDFIDKIGYFRLQKERGGTIVAVNYPTESFAAALNSEVEIR